MIEVQGVMEINNSSTFCWKTTKKGSFSTDICMGVFFILSVSDTIFEMSFLAKPPADRLGSPVVDVPQFEKP
jgi:hypothetical protein